MCLEKMRAFLFAGDYDLTQLNRKQLCTSKEGTLKYIFLLFEKGLFLQALEEINLLSKEKISPEEELCLMLLTAKIYAFNAKLQEAKELISELYVRIAQMNITKQIFLIELLTLEGIIQRASGKYDEAIRFHEKALAIIIAHNDNFTDFKRETLGYIAISLYFKGKLESARPYIEQAMQLPAQSANAKFVAPHTLVKILVEEGKWQKARDMFNDLIAQSKDKYMHYYARFLANRSIVYQNLGDFKRASNDFSKSLQIFEANGDIRGANFVYERIGNLYFNRGDTANALESYQKNLANSLKFENSVEIAWAMKNIAIVNYTQKFKENATQYLESALAICRDIENDVKAAEILYYLIIMADEVTATTQQYMDALFELAKRNKTNDKIQLRAKLSEAFLLKQSLRVIDKFRAQQIYFKILSEDVVLYELTINAYFNLFDLLLLEYKISDEKEVLNDINTVIDKLNGIAEKIDSASVRVETMILQAKFMLLEKEIERAQELLSEAKKIAKKNGLERLHTKIQAEEIVVIQQIAQWSELIEKNKQAFEEAQRNQIMDYLKEVSRIVNI